MKSLTAAFIFIFTTVFAAHSQTPVSSLTPLLSLYYDVKNALVNSDPVTASAKAGEFAKAVNGIDIKSLSASDSKAFTPLQSKLSSDARHIAENKDIGRQREYFAAVSVNFHLLASAVKLSAEPIYQAYCPMKKAYWLSNETGIKNPYYGKTMLTCGNVTETIQP